MTASIPGDTRDDDDPDRPPSTEPARGSKDLEKSNSPDPFADLFSDSDSLSSDEHLAKPSKIASKKHKTKHQKKDQKKDQKVKKKKKKEKKHKK